MRLPLPVKSLRDPLIDAVDGHASATTQNLTQLEAPEELRRSYCVVTLGVVATGALTAHEAMIRVDTVRSLEALARHA